MKKKYLRVSLRIVLIIFALSFKTNAQSIEDLVKANQAYNGQKWQDALSEYQKITIANPYNGEYWFQLGRIQYNLKNYNASNIAYENAIETGYDLSTSAYNMACNYSLLNERKKAISWLNFAVKNGLRGREELLSEDTDLDNIRAEEGFQRLMSPFIPSDISREEGWSTDLTYLKRKFEITHYDLFSLIDKADWENSFDNLKRNVDHLENFEIIVRLMEIVASIGAGHSYVIPPFSGINQFNQLPVEFYRFNDGIYIKSALDQYSDMVGNKIISINNKPIEEILKKVKRVSNPENIIISDWTALFYLTLPEVLKYYGFTDNIDNLEITFENNQGQIVSKNISSQPFNPQIVMSKSVLAGWTSMLDASDNGPMYLKNTNKKFWFQQIQDSKVLYAQVNEIRNGGNKTLKQFGKEITDYISTNDISAFILDLRLNNGGNGLLNRDFLTQIIKCEKINQRGKFFTIIGRKTFSAAMLLATQLDEYTETVFIGEPTGGSPNMIGDDNQIVLPYSGLITSASSKYWQSHISYDTRNWIAPEILTSLSSNQYRSGQDPCVETILDIVSGQ
ncbi:tetratricopeptide repeat protein [Winogradskyella sp.]|uniref:tetratricopeptide repeat protein n=1 Tax=Winogradskyella sp. TaxID=1883156 RepID=UPI002626B3EE|nr:tetratricopeptide repeat protein [Winogradskyella sp.]